MKFGINTLRWTSDFDLEQVPPLAQIRQWGFDGVEITRRRLTGFPARIIRETAKNEGLDVTFCTSLPDGLSLVNAKLVVYSLVNGQEQEVANATMDKDGFPTQESWVTATS